MDSGEDGEESVEGIWAWDLTRDSSVVTLDSRARIVLCAASCCACSMEESSTTDSNCDERVLRRWNSLSNMLGL
jgi:hypothetical protein